MSYLKVSDRKAIVLAILQGRAADAFEKHGVLDVERIVLARAADRLAEHVASRTSPVRGYYRLRRRTPLLVGYVLAATAAAVPLVCALWIASHADFSAPADYPLVGAAATLFGVFAAASGWGVASWTAHRNARAQHTINFLATRFTNSSFSEQTAIFNRAFMGKTIDRSLVDALALSKQPEDTAALQALRYILNWFEFIAVGVLLGDLDIEIVTKTVRSNLILYCDRCLPYIAQVQASQPRVLENLMELRRHFREH